MPACECAHGRVGWDGGLGCRDPLHTDCLKGRVQERGYLALFLCRYWKLEIHCLNPKWMEDGTEETALQPGHM